MISLRSSLLLLCLLFGWSASLGQDEVEETYVNRVAAALIKRLSKLAGPKMGMVNPENETKPLMPQGKVVSGVNLFTGQPVRSMPLAAIDAGNGINLQIEISYSPMQDENVAKVGRLPTNEVVGWDWGLSFPFIQRIDQGTVDESDDLFFCSMGELGGGQLIFQRASTDGRQLYFFLESNPSLKIIAHRTVLNLSHASQSQLYKWEVLSLDGRQMIFGEEGNATRYKRFYGNSLILSEKATGKLPYQWDLFVYKNQFGSNKLRVSYIQKTEMINGGTKEYIRAARPERITILDAYGVVSRELEFAYTEYNGFSGTKISRQRQDKWDYFLLTNVSYREKQNSGLMELVSRVIPRRDAVYMDPDGNPANIGKGILNSIEIESWNKFGQIQKDTIAQFRYSRLAVGEADYRNIYLRKVRYPSQGVEEEILYEERTGYAKPITNLSLAGYDQPNLRTDVQPVCVEKGCHIFQNHNVDYPATTGWNFHPMNGVSWTNPTSWGGMGHTECDASVPDPASLGRYCSITHTMGDGYVIIYDQNEGPMKIFQQETDDTWTTINSGNWDQFIDFEVEADRQEFQHLFVATALQGNPRWVQIHAGGDFFVVDQSISDMSHHTALTTLTPKGERYFWVVERAGTKWLVKKMNFGADESPASCGGLAVMASDYYGGIGVRETGSRRCLSVYTENDHRNVQVALGNTGFTILYDRHDLLLSFHRDRLGRWKRVPFSRDEYVGANGSDDASGYFRNPSYLGDLHEKVYRIEYLGDDLFARLIHGRVMMFQFDGVRMQNTRSWVSDKEQVFRGGEDYLLVGSTETIAGSVEKELRLWRSTQTPAGIAWPHPGTFNLTQPMPGFKGVRYANHMRNRTLSNEDYVIQMQSIESGKRTYSEPDDAEAKKEFWYPDQILGVTIKQSGPVRPFGAFPGNCEGLLQSSVDLSLVGHVLLGVVSHNEQGQKCQVPNDQSTKCSYSLVQFILPQHPKPQKRNTCQVLHTVVAGAEALLPHHVKLSANSIHGTMVYPQYGNEPYKEWYAFKFRSIGDGFTPELDGMRIAQKTVRRDLATGEEMTQQFVFPESEGYYNSRARGMFFRSAAVIDLESGTNRQVQSHLVNFHLYGHEDALFMREDFNGVPQTEILTDYLKQTQNTTNYNYSLRTDPSWPEQARLLRLDRQRQVSSDRGGTTEENIAYSDYHPLLGIPLVTTRMIPEDSNIDSTWSTELEICQNQAKNIPYICRERKSFRLVSSSHCASAQGCDAPPILLSSARMGASPILQQGADTSFQWTGGNWMPGPPQTWFSDNPPAFTDNDHDFLETGRVTRRSTVDGKVLESVLWKMPGQTTGASVYSTTIFAGPWGSPVLQVNNARYDEVRFLGAEHRVLVPEGLQVDGDREWQNISGAHVSTAKKHSGMASYFARTSASLSAEINPEGLEAESRGWRLEGWLLRQGNIGSATARLRIFDAQTGVQLLTKTSNIPVTGELASYVWQPWSVLLSRRDLQSINAVGRRLKILGEVVTSQGSFFIDDWVLLPSDALYTINGFDHQGRGTSTVGMDFRKSEVALDRSGRPIIARDYKKRAFSQGATHRVGEKLTEGGL